MLWTLTLVDFTHGQKSCFIIIFMTFYKKFLSQCHFSSNKIVFYCFFNKWITMFMALLIVQHLNLRACDLAFKEKLILHQKREVQLVIFLRFAVNFKSVINVTFAQWYFILCGGFCTTSGLMPTFIFLRLHEYSVEKSWQGEDQHGRREN